MPFFAAKKKQGRKEKKKRTKIKKKKKKRKRRRVRRYKINDNIISSHDLALCIASGLDVHLACIQCVYVCVCVCVCLLRNS